MHRIMRSLSRPNSVVETPQSKGRTSVRPSFGFLSSRTKSPTLPDIFVLQFPHRTVEQQLKQSTTPHITFSPAPPIPRREQEREQEQAQERGERFLHPNPKRQRRINRRHNNSNNKNNDNCQKNKDMEIENIVVVPPRTRLFELKSSAEFAAEDFNHTIKTWVNMASLLVKQGNMAESNQDDENAYISYVRACLIITKIIPIQPHYRSMMNDIVCIDLRQKILVIITRMGHLEKRLLKRFEDDNRQAASRIKRGSTMTHLTSLSGKTIVASPMVHRQIHHHRPTSTIYRIERTMNKLSVEYSPEEPVGDQDDNDNDDDQELIDGSGVYDDENDGNDINDDEVAVVEIQEDYSAAIGADLGLELSSESYISHHHRRTTAGSRSPSPPQPTQQHDYDRDRDQHHIAPEKPLGGTLKKKSSNEDDRSLLSPECQPNFTAMPSALFPRQREGSHVRRCSSTDAIRTSVHFPATSSLSTATALPLTITPRAALTTPPVPVRSDKRASMMASVSVDRGSISTSSINYLRDRSNSGVATVAVVPDYRGTAAAGNSGAVPTTTAVRGGYDRDVLHSRFLNRRTLSFEGNGSSFYPPLGASSFDGSQQHQQQHQHQHQQQNFAGAHALRRHNSTSVGRVTPSSNNSSTNNIGSSPQKPATFNHHLLQQHQQQQQQAPQHQRNSTDVLSLNTDLPPTPRSSLEKLSEHFSAGSSYNNINNSRSSPPSSASPSTATSTPLTSPMMKTSAQMNHGRGQGHEYGHSHGHGHTPSLSSSITSSSTLAMTESTLAMSSAPATATNSSITYTPTTMSVGSPQLSSTSSSPTMAGISTWATTGKKAGLLRKIRSKPKMQEMFDMVQATPSPPTPSTPSPVTPLPLPLHRQQQYQQYQQQPHQQQQQQQQAYPSIAMRS
ncbi:MAG: hypothetical protein J3R72DRAFT_449610 [Linnemannia gamsii]|nr:MAG: hypothetical protein J3R72DRAFT_449610 [Linnemannia gamsii]